MPLRNEIPLFIALSELLPYAADNLCQSMIGPHGTDYEVG